MIQNNKRIFTEYREVLESRHIEKYNWKDSLKYNGKFLEILYSKYRNDLEELMQIMESRGFFLNE
jgi:hypothetical protein